MALGSIPKNIVYVPVDFASERLEDQLSRKDYDINLKTFFLWDGVTMYFTTEAVNQTSAFIANHSGKGSIVVLDYLLKWVLDKTFSSEEVEMF